MTEIEKEPHSGPGPDFVEPVTVSLPKNSLRPRKERVNEDFYPDPTDHPLETQIAQRKAERDAISGKDTQPSISWPEFHKPETEPDVIFSSPFQPSDRPRRIMTTPTEGYALPEVPTTPGEFRIDVHAKAAEDKLSTPPTPRRRRLSLSKQPKSA